MKASVKYNNRKFETIDVDSEESAYETILANSQIQSIKLIGLPLGETEREFTRDAAYARKHASPCNADGIATISWSNCD